MITGRFMMYFLQSSFDHVRHEHDNYNREELCCPAHEKKNALCKKPKNSGISRNSSKFKRKIRARRCKKPEKYTSCNSGFAAVFPVQIRLKVSKKPV